MRSLAPALVAPLLLLPGCSAVEATPAGPSWRTSSAQAMSDVLDAPVRDETCRQVMRLTAVGDRLRLRLSNALSPTPLRISALTAAVRAAGPSAVPGSVRPVTVGGERAFEVPAGEQLTTDPFGLEVVPGTDLLVSFAVTGTARLSEHRYGAATGWCSAAGSGDLTGQDSGGAFLEGARDGLVVEDVAVAVPAGTPPAVIAVGDSLTDAPLPPDTYPRWTDQLAERLNGRPVANAAIAGNFVVLEGGYGPPLRERFARDVLSRSGIGSVVLLAGTNDLSRGIPAERLIAELQRLVDTAQAADLEVLLVTIPPAVGREPSEQAARRTVNEWVRRRSGADAVVDADRLLRDPGEQERLAAGFDVGDGLHLSVAGHRALAAEVAEALAD